METVIAIVWGALTLTLILAPLIALWWAIGRVDTGPLIMPNMTSWYAGAVVGFVLYWVDARTAGNGVLAVFTVGGPWDLTLFSFFARTNPLDYPYALFWWRWIRQDSLAAIAVDAALLSVIAATALRLIRGLPWFLAVRTPAVMLLVAALAFYAANLLTWMVNFFWPVAAALMLLFGRAGKRRIEVWRNGQFSHEYTLGG